MADAYAGQSKGRQAGKQGKRTATGPQSPVQHRTSRPQDEREGTEEEVQKVMHLA